MDWTRTFIIGGGASLIGFDFEKIRGKGLLLGINDSALKLNTPALFSIDVTWMKNRVEQMKQYNGEIHLAVPIDRYRQRFDVPNAIYYKRLINSGFSKDGSGLHGYNSGYGGLNLAYYKGAKEIYLLGFDMQMTNGKTHWHDSYEWHNPINHRLYGSWCRYFDDASKILASENIKCVNCGLDSKLECFHKIPLEDLYSL